MISLLINKKQTNHINEIVIEVTEKYYSNISKINDIENKILLINTISEISNSIYDFYIDIARRNNVFYCNVNQISKKLIKNIFLLNSALYIYNNLESAKNKKLLIKDFFHVFKFSKNDKKIFYKYLDIYNYDKDSFRIEYTKLFSSKIFSSRVMNRMEFLYINHYLESSLDTFRRSYKNFLLEV